MTIQAICHPDKKRHTKEGLCGTCRARQRYQTDPEYRVKKLKIARHHYVKSKYGMAQDAYEEKVAEQKGLCSICLLPETTVDPRTGSVRRLSVDHNHETGQVRGLLCSNCNAGVGMFQEDPIRLSRAIEYINNHSHVKGAQ